MVKVVVLVLWSYHCNTMELYPGVHSTENKNKIVVINLLHMVVPLDKPSTWVAIQSLAEIKVWPTGHLGFIMCNFCTTLHIFILPCLRWRKDLRNIKTGSFHQNLYTWCLRLVLYNGSQYKKINIII